MLKKFRILNNNYFLQWMLWIKRTSGFIIVFFSFIVLGLMIYSVGFPSTAPFRATFDNALLKLPYLFMFAWITRYVSGILIKKRRKEKLITIIYLFLFIILLPTIFPESGSEYMTAIWQKICFVLKSKYYVATVLSIISIIEISNTIAGIHNKKTNPSRILAISFLAVIAIGTGLLLLPKATVNGISTIDALFISTSATCVTGLTPIDVAATFTPLGKIIICLLIQVGGLGIMTMTSFFAMFFMGNRSLYNQIVISSLISSDNIGSLLSALWKILLFTALIELTGVIAIFFSIHGTLGYSTLNEIYFSLFHSISAFCNAGFSTLPGNLADKAVAGNNSLYLSISGLIILGGIGFPILANFITLGAYYIKNIIRKLFDKNHRIRRKVHLLSLNSRIVLITTAILLIGGTAAMACSQWYTLTGNTWDRLVQSFFLAVTPRTAGFNSVPMETLGVQSLLITMFLMWVGGSSQSTAGGIKINAFAVAVINLWSAARGKHKSELFGRDIRSGSTNMANATIVASLFVIITALFMLTILEPGIPVLNLLFEAISALGTVGLSLNTTPLLGEGARLVIITLMFIGRIGIITLLLGIVKRHSNNKFDYPKENIIIT
jgi:Trk-type K+ transport system membrane component